MQIRIEEIYWLKFDREEAEQFLEDASGAQERMRGVLYRDNTSNEKASSPAQRAP